MYRTANSHPKPGKNRKQPRPQPESIGQRPQKHHRQRRRLEPADGGDHPQQKQRPEGQRREQQIQQHRQQPPGKLPSKAAEKVKDSCQRDAQREADPQEPCLGVDGNDHPKSLRKKPPGSGSSA